MGWRGIALLSVGVNLVLAIAWVASDRPKEARRAAPVATNQVATNQPGRTGVLVRREFLKWHELESDDYPTYIANLRLVGCPESTIRDIIIADVNTMFARRRATELLTPEQQWWRSEPDSNVLAAAFAKAQALEEDRQGLLASLLGPNWESGDLATIPRPSRPGVTLDGAILGTLLSDTKLAVQNISMRTQDRIQDYLDQAQRDGKDPDPAELVRLRQQMRYELAGVLNPLQLEEFLLRYSENANALRTSFGALQYFNPSPDEFRAVFRSTDPIDQQIAALTGNDANSVQARRTLETQRENALKLALGSERYQEYRLLQDPLYRQAVTTAREAGTPEAAKTIYHVNLAAAEEQARIDNDRALSEAQKAVERKQLELEQLKANTLATGNELPPEAPPAPVQPPRRTYTARPGDSLAVVALIYGVPPSAIQAANPSLDFNRLRPGDSILIPRSALSPPSGP